MMKIGTVFEVSYAHRILNHPGKCSYLHGHNGKVEVEIGADVHPETGMVLDFSILKGAGKDWVERHLDHATILQESDPLLEVVEKRLVTLSHPPTAEMLSYLILTEGVWRSLQPAISWARVRFWETQDCYAECVSPGKPLEFEWHWATR